MFPGNFEYLYFLNYDFESSQTGNSANWVAFQNVMLYNNTNPGENYEYLFLTYDLNNGEGSDPQPNSLFNMNTMQ